MKVSTIPNPVAVTNAHRVSNLHSRQPITTYNPEISVVGTSARHEELSMSSMDETHLGPSQGHLLPLPIRPRRWPYILSIVALSLTVICLGLAFAYSTYSAQEWREAATKSNKDLASMTKQRDGQKAEIEDLKTQLADVTVEYKTANDRIRSLSNEKARTGDEAAYYATLVAMSQNVTEGMDMCIDNLQQLQTYLVNYDSYEAVSLLNYARQINSGCNQARADSEALSRKLAG